MLCFAQSRERHIDILQFAEKNLQAFRNRMHLDPVSHQTELDMVSDCDIVSCAIGKSSIAKKFEVPPSLQLGGTSTFLIFFWQLITSEDKTKALRREVDEL